MTSRSVSEIWTPADTQIRRGTARPTIWPGSPSEPQECIDTSLAVPATITSSFGLKRVQIRREGPSVRRQAELGFQNVAEARIPRGDHEPLVVGDILWTNRCGTRNDV